MSIPFLSLQAATAELRPELDEAVSRVLSSGHYIGGPEVEAFEAEFAAYVGARHCIGVGNGLDALTLSLIAHGVEPRSEVLVPSNTFIATWLGATHAGCVPVPVEPDFGTHLVTVDQFDRALTPRTRACMPVHLYGLAADMPGLTQWSKARGLTLIDDAAQAHGAAVGARRIGAFESTTTWSFYPGKNLGALGDAGAITTQDDGVAARLRQLRNYGSSEKYVHDVTGYNSRLDPIQAAVLRVKLRHLDEWNARRQKIAAHYDAALSGVGDLRLPVVPRGHTHVHHLYVVRTSRRDALRAHLEARGIGTIIHYPTPPHLQGAYATARIDRAAFEETARAAAEVLSLPIGPHLSGEQAALVTQAVREYFGEPA